MAKLTPEQKAQNAFDRALQSAKQYSAKKYCTKYVAPEFQKCIRAEWAALPAGETTAVVECELVQVWREVGQCVCVTCGRIAPWTTPEKTMHTGHFIASRRNSILLVEDNVAPQCYRCNFHGGGEQQLFRKWMMHVRGRDAIEEIERRKNTSVSFALHDLVEWKIGYTERLKKAIETIETSV